MRRTLGRLTKAIAGLVAAAIISSGAPALAGEGLRELSELRITILSTMLADDGLGEWGFAALIEADGKRILFDTGQHPRLVLDNAAELGIDLGGVSDVVLSHHHADHVGGLLALREELSKRGSAAISTAHAGEGALWRRLRNGRDANDLRAGVERFERLGGRMVTHSRPFELVPGIWLSGPIPRGHAEQPPSAGVQLLAPGGPRPDDLPEDLALYLLTPEGTVVVTGCAHAGIVNTVEQAERLFPGRRISGILGGLHLFDADRSKLEWTSGELKKRGIDWLMGAHCTGIQSLFELRTMLGLERSECVVGAVGAGYSRRLGVTPLAIAR